MDRRRGERGTIGVREMGGKGDMLKGERETDNRLPSDKAARQNDVMEGIHRKIYSEAVIKGLRKRVRVFVGDSIIRNTDRVLNKGDDVVVCLPAPINRGDNLEGIKHCGFGQGWMCFSTHREK